MSKKPVIAITMGDPAGIGPEIILKALARQNSRRVSFLVVGDSLLLKNCPCPVVDMKNVDMKKFRYGKISAMCGKAAIEYIKKGVDIIKSGAADALVTAPISKEAANLAGFKWPGHTEYLAYLTATKKFCMMLAGGPLKVVLATRHIALKDVSRQLNTEEIYNSIILTANFLKKYFKIKNPKIAVSALNPHAGEGGMFSDEEKRIIMPAIKKAVGASGRSPLRIIGPLPADSLFYNAYKGAYDAEIVMYHDQGLIPLKMAARDIGVNITFGLPFARTSPAHGTAFDIAGKDMANSSSMAAAIDLAIQMSHG